jgi:transposase-like protein
MKLYNIFRTSCLADEFLGNNSDEYIGKEANLTMESKQDVDIEKFEMLNYFIKKRFSEPPICPHCGGHEIVRNGKYSGKQRYKCKFCRTTFSDFTSTPLSMTHYPDKWKDFMECMLQGMSLRTTASKIKVSYVTLFYWRHKILEALRQIVPEEMNGVIEADDIYVAYSRKGSRHIDGKAKRQHVKSVSSFNMSGKDVCVLAASDHFRNVISVAACRGYLRKENIDKAIGGFVDSKTILCSNNKSAYVLFSNIKKIKHYRITGMVHRQEEKYGIATVKKYIKDCMRWLARFKGVATRYLNNYLSWYKFLDNIDFDSTMEGIKKIAECISTKMVCETYSSIRLANEEI